MKAPGLSVTVRCFALNIQRSVFVFVRLMFAECSNTSAWQRSDARLTDGTITAVWCWTATKSQKKTDTSRQSYTYNELMIKSQTVSELWTNMCFIWLFVKVRFSIFSIWLQTKKGTNSLKCRFTCSGKKDLSETQFSIDSPPEAEGRESDSSSWSELLLLYIKELKLP